MKPTTINYTASFKKCMAKVPKSQLKYLDRQEKIFRLNIFDPRLKTHKLTGKLAGFYAFSVSYHWRIVFHLVKQTVIFDNIGTHAVYK